MILRLAFLTAALAPAAVTANTLTFQGVTFEMFASGNILTLNINNALGATDDWLGIQSLASFEVKNVSTNNGTVTSTNTSRDWLYAAGGVNNGGAVGCGGGDNTSSCFNAMSGGVLDPSPLSNFMTWDIDFGAPINLAAPSLKVLFLDGDGVKQGSLLSMTVPVPEPEIYAMMGIGLAVVGWLGRRKKAQEGVPA